MSTCAYCRNPLDGPGHAGRPWPDRPPAAYCCFGCLTLGEDRQRDVTPSPASPAWKLDPLGIRLGIGVVVVGQSMAFGLALNLHDDVPPAARGFTQGLIL